MIAKNPYGLTKEELEAYSAQIQSTRRENEKVRDTSSLRGIRRWLDEEEVAIAQIKHGDPWMRRRHL